MVIWKNKRRKGNYIQRVLATCLVFALLFSLVVVGGSPVAGAESGVAAERVVEDPRPLNFNPDDVFDVYRQAGAEYEGYLFVLRDGVVYCFETYDAIEEIAPPDIHWAATIEDIRTAVDEANILFIEPNYAMESIEFEYEPAELPLIQPFAFQPTNDPLFHQQWNFVATRTAAAWTANSRPGRLFDRLSGRGVTVAVLDTGVFRGHEDIDGSRVFPAIGYGRVVGGSNDGPGGQGTAVIGIIAAIRDNGRGIASIAPETTILPKAVRIAHPQGDFDTDVIASLIPAMRDTISRGDVDVIHFGIALSLRSAILEGEVDRAHDAGIIMIAPVGNLGSPQRLYPAGFSNVIGVGATSQHDWVTPFSQINDTVSFVAPGHQILTLGISAPNAYVTAGGTSIAAAHVTGMAALARGYNPNITSDQFYDLLRRSAIGLGVPGVHDGWNPYHGHGLVDIGLFVHRLTEEDFFRFTDITNHRHNAAITFAARYGIMHGTGHHQSLFHPDWVANRAEFVTALANMYRLTMGTVPHVDYSLFPDVPVTHWAARHITWANRIGIVGGVGDGTFAPANPMIRQDVAIVLLRYARHQGIGVDPIDLSVLNRFTDQHQIHSWAREAVAWAVQSGLMAGTSPTTFGPLDPILRGEIAAISHRYTVRLAPLAVAENTASELFTGVFSFEDAWIHNKEVE